MKKPSKYIEPLLILAYLAVLSGCNCNCPDVQKTELGSEKDYEASSNLEMYAHTISQYSMPNRETFILLQNRYGIRIEYCLDRHNLQLWISPKAWKSLDYRDRNWSCRDDHTDIFDRISIPGMSLANFEKCDYDPFHSVIYFKGGKKLHLAHLFDKPVILVWTEQDAVVDFKSFKEDKIIKADSTRFIIEHKDRGRTFTFAALVNKGKGKFRHQKDIDAGRSLYARAELKANQPLVISGELTEENPVQLAESGLNVPLEKLLSENEKKINDALKYGSFQLKNKPEMQKLLDINKRIALSMQDGGMMRSTNQYIYYLIWFRDNGMNTAHICQTGWAEPAGAGARIAIMNPIEAKNPDGRFFGCLMAGPLGKWEEDGIFYVLWPAFLYWTQTGDSSYVSGKYLKNLEDGIDWLERWIYDEKKGLFGRYYACETPFANTREYGYDDAVGNPVNYFEIKYRNKIVARSYDIYINSLMYSVYNMMAAVEKDKKSDLYLAKAKILEKNMQRFYREKELPFYGDVLMQDKTTELADPYGLDNWDYAWALSIPPFKPNLPVHYRNWAEALFKDMTTSKRKEYFLCCYNAILTSIDPEYFNEDSIMSALEYQVPQSIKPGKFLPMPYTIPEVLDAKEGDPFHDVRPLVYSIAPWLSAVTNLGVRRLPFGLSVRNTKYLSSLNNYQYLKKLINFSYNGTGTIGKILINGQELKNAWQLPDNWLSKDINDVVVDMKQQTNHKNVWISSTLRLKDITDNNGITFSVLAFNQNIITFKNLAGKISVLNAAKESIPFIRKDFEKYSNIEFSGRGNYSIIIK